ncbi:Tvp15 [Kluyveromyces lactis]|nr:Tvp15 [Kluyveromyces lactis]
MSDSQILNLYRFACIGFSGVLTLLFLTQAIFNILPLDTFVRGLIGLGLSVLLGVLEFRELPLLDKYASFYYTYAGRGALFTLLYALLKYDGFFSIIVGVLLWPMALVHLFLHLNPDVGQPTYFKTTNIALSANDDEQDIV